MPKPMTFDVSCEPDSLSIVLSSTMECIDRVDTIVKNMMHDKGLAIHSFAVRVVMREGLTNSVRHGHKHDPDKLIRFNLKISGSILTMIIEDQGEGFDWRAIMGKDRIDSRNESPTDHGRGFFIMDDYFDTCDFNEKGNILILGKNISS